MRLSDSESLCRKRRIDPGVMMHPLRWLVAFALLGALTIPEARAADSALPWSSDLQKSLEAARKSGKKVFVDFTGDG